MNKEKGLAYCGLACCICGENETYNVNIAYICKYFTGELITQTDETIDLKWFELDELPNNISPPVKPALTRCLEVLNNRKKKNGGA